MSGRREIEIDPVLVAFAVLFIVDVVLLLPDAWSFCLWLWKWIRIVLNVRNWPFWIWTCIGVVVLCALVWLQSRHERVEGHRGLRRDAWLL